MSVMVVMMIMLVIVCRRRLRHDWTGFQEKKESVGILILTRICRAARGKTALADRRIRLRARPLSPGSGDSAALWHARRAHCRRRPSWGPRPRTPPDPAAHAAWPRCT